MLPNMSHKQQHTNLENCEAFVISILDTPIIHRIQRLRSVSESLQVVINLGDIETQDIQALQIEHIVRDLDEIENEMTEFMYNLIMQKLTEQRRQGA
jgi:hypothetical protein